LLNAVENGTVSGAQLQVFLGDTGRLVEFRVLLSMRGQARRIASSDVSVAAIVASQIARDTVFKTASAENSVAARALINNATAVGLISLSLPALTEVEANATSWSYWTTGPSFEINVRNMLDMLGNVNDSSLTTVQSMFANSSAHSKIVSSRACMRVIVASLSSVDLMAQAGGMMDDVSGDIQAMGILTASSGAMDILVQNAATSMSKLAANPVSMVALSQSPTAMASVYGDAVAWSSFRGSSQASVVLTDAVRNLAGVVGAFPTLTSMVDNSTQFAKVTNSPGAAQLFAQNTDAVIYLATSANLSLALTSTTLVNAIASSPGAVNALVSSATNLQLALGNTVLSTAIGNSLTAVDILATSPNFIHVVNNIDVMAAFANSATAVSALVGNATNFAAALASSIGMGGLFSSPVGIGYLLGSSSNNTRRGQVFDSSAAKGAMFTSNLAIDTIASTPAIITYLKANGAVVTTGTVVPNSAGAGNPTAFGGGVPSKILMLTATQIGIAAIPTAYTYGTAVAGSAKGATLTLQGIAALAPDQNPHPHVATYENLSVISAAGVIAITGVTRITYYSMM
jgi:hypothetical protein